MYLDKTFEIIGAREGWYIKKNGKALAWAETYQKAQIMAQQLKFKDDYFTNLKKNGKQTA